jgi:putative SOS response-associated peptidase YedK
MAERHVSYATGPAGKSGEPGAVIRYGHDREIELVNLVWGFAPPEPGARPFTYIRSEGRSFGSRRCLIPASEFTVSNGQGTQRRKWRASLAVTEGLFYLAGIWRPAQGNWPPSYALITISAGPDVAPYQDRQAAVISREDRMNWLDQLEPQAKLLSPLPKGTFWLEQVEGPKVEQAIFAW